MALVGTGKWTPEGKAASSKMDRDFFSGPISTGSTTYTDALEFDFGFAAVEVVITNTGTAAIVYQWLSRKGTNVDSGAVEAGKTVHFHMANKSGIRVRTDGGTITGHISAVG